MMIWVKIAIFETTAKTSVLGRWGVTPDLQYGKKIKKFPSEVLFSPKKKLKSRFERQKGLRVSIDTGTQCGTGYLVHVLLS